MHEAALDQLDAIDAADGFSLCLYQPDWHQGVVGILASRLKERFHRPAIAFARGTDGMLKGSGRSIAGLHLRDALDLVSKRAPCLIARFGGHAAAAGLTIAESSFRAFAQAFDAVCREQLTPSDLARVIETDGALTPAELVAESALALQQEVWGQGFAAPLFDGEFLLRRQRIVGQRHSRLLLETEGKQTDAILFGFIDPLPERLRAVYRVAIDEYGGANQLQLVIDHWESAA
jgi:single-stranded-DNA-specific exonuclease